MLTHALLACRVNSQQQAQEARILDLAWSGKEGRACYPGFLNGKANWPLKNPDGKKITQRRDRMQLEQSIKLCEEKAAASRSRQVLPPAATGRRHYQGVQGQFRRVLHLLPFTEASSTKSGSVDVYFSSHRYMIIAMLNSLLSPLCNTSVAYHLHACGDP